MQGADRGADEGRRTMEEEGFSFLFLVLQRACHSMLPKTERKGGKSVMQRIKK
jgi:hypothetical protein